jgi:preprotein translocase subunit YajC
MVFASLMNLLLAQGAGGGGAPAGGDGGLGGMGGFFIPMLAMLAFVYLLMIRPAQKQEKQRKQMIYTIKRGDDVVFCGGIMGTVIGIKEKTAGTATDGDEVTIRTDGNNKLRVLRSSIYQVTPTSTEAAEVAEKSA